MFRPKLAALILAAGYSSRMGHFKPLLPLENKPVIACSIDNFRRAGIENITVVVGYQAAILQPLLQDMGVRVVVNENYRLGMFSSILAGLETFAHQVEGFYLLPGDIPLVKKRTIQKLGDKYTQTSSSVIYPTLLGKRGHPPLITRKCFQQILAQDSSGNLRTVLEQFADDSWDVECIDQGILLDMDTPEDYQQMQLSLQRRSIPTGDECQGLFCLYNTPLQVIRHGRAVAKRAKKIAHLLNSRASYALDIELVRTAALLHDIAKGRPDHSQVGADILEQEGFPLVAKVIASHMDLPLDPQDPVIDEKGIVFLADKMIKDEELISLEERFKVALKRYKDQPHILAKVKDRFNKALILKDKIENFLGEGDLYSILS